jgi:DNA-binding GntR family transcriptional regulator
MLRHRGTFDREHREILAALYERNADLAAQRLEKHLAGASGLLIGELQRVEMAVAP